MRKVCKESSKPAKNAGQELLSYTPEECQKRAFFSLIVCACDAGMFGRVKYIALICLAILALTACDSEIKEGGGDGKRIEKNAGAVKEERLAEHFTDRSYPYCNSTNLYKMPDQEQAEDDGVSLIQYDLQGNHRREIRLHGKEKYVEENLISVDDQWIYYAYYRDGEPAICRMPIVKKDGCDHIDTSGKQILCYPEKRTAEEKARGVEEKMVACGYCATSKYIVYFQWVGYQGADDFKDELVRYDLETGKTSTKSLGKVKLDYDMEIRISGEGNEIVCCQEGVIYALDVEKMEMRRITSHQYGSYAVSPDGSVLVCGEDHYEYREKEPARIYFYSLKDGELLALASSHEIRRTICQAEGVDARDISCLYNDVLGCYGDKAYMRYQVEYDLDGKRLAHYGIMSMTMSEEPKLSFEQGITETMRQECAEYQGRWRQYHKYTKKERERAKKAGVKLKKKLEKTCEVRVNFGNPQRVIGNQLFCRSVNVDMHQNHWFCINLDTGERERIDRKDARYRWIYCENLEGWTHGDDGNYFSDDFLFLDGDERSEVVWEQGEEQHSGKEVRQKDGKGNGRDAGTVQEQLRYLAEHRYEWLGALVEFAEIYANRYDEIPMMGRLEEANYGRGLYYMVTDLDQDGRLEIVTSDMGGTGQFTDINVYELSPKTHKPELLHSGEGEDPDIGGLEKTTFYYDRKKKRYWYYGEDFIHSGMDNWNNMELWSVSRHGKFACRSYGRAGRGEGDQRMQYYLGDQKVTKKEYVRKKKNLEPGMEKGKATFGWKQDRKDLIEIDDEELLERLTKSWKGFSLNIL